MFFRLDLGFWELMGLLLKQTWTWAPVIARDHLSEVSLGKTLNPYKLCQAVSYPTMTSDLIERKKKEEFLVQALKGIETFLKDAHIKKIVYAEFKATKF